MESRCHGWVGDLGSDGIGGQRYKMLRENRIFEDADGEARRGRVGCWQSRGGRAGGVAEYGEIMSTVMAKANVENED